MIKFDLIRDQIIGKDFIFESPFGTRLLTYADYTASGRTLKFIEEYLLFIQRSYANTHTEDDVTGRYMTKLLQASEKLIKKTVNAEKDYYIISTGTGATGALSKLLEVLGVYVPPAT